MQSSSDPLDDTFQSVTVDAFYSRQHQSLHSIHFIFFQPTIHGWKKVDIMHVYILNSIWKQRNTWLAFLLNYTHCQNVSLAETAGVPTDQASLTTVPCGHTQSMLPICHVRSKYDRFLEITYRGQCPYSEAPGQLSFSYNVLCVCGTSQSAAVMYTQICFTAATNFNDLNSHSPSAILLSFYLIYS